MNGRAAAAAGTKPSFSPHLGTGSAHINWETQTGIVNIHLALAICIMYAFISETETYTDIHARSLEMSLDFLNSLQRAKRSTQNG